MKASDTDVLFTGTLLRLDEPCSSVDADNEITRDLRVESSTVSCLLDTEDSLDPSDDLVRGRVGGFVEIDDTVPDVV